MHKLTGQADASVFDNPAGLPTYLLHGASGVQGVAQSCPCSQHISMHFHELQLPIASFAATTLLLSCVSMQQIPMDLKARKSHRYVDGCALASRPYSQLAVEQGSQFLQHRLSRLVFFKQCSVALHGVVDSRHLMAIADLCCLQSQHMRRATHRVAEGEKAHDIMQPGSHPSQQLHHQTGVRISRGPDEIDHLGHIMLRLARPMRTACL